MDGELQCFLDHAHSNIITNAHQPSPFSPDSTLPSPLQNTSINGHIVSRHVSAGIRCEEDARSPNVIWLRYGLGHNFVLPALQQMWEGCCVKSVIMAFCIHTLAPLFGLPRTCHLRSNIAWGYRIHSDAVLSDLNCHGRAHRQDCAFLAAVGTGHLAANGTKRRD